MERNWQGLYRCPEHNEPRQPQDFARGVKDIMTVPWAQLETDTFRAVCTLAGISSVPGFATPGCSLPHMPLLPGAADTALDNITDQIGLGSAIGQGGSIGL